MKYMKLHQYKECCLSSSQVEDDYVQEMDRRMRDVAFSKLDATVESWYQGENGRIVANWVGGVTEYQQRLRDSAAKDEWRDAYLFS